MRTLSFKDAKRDGPGLAPLSSPGPAQGFDHISADALDLVPDDVKSMVIGACMDMVINMTKGGASDQTLRALKSMTRRVIRGCYEVEVRRLGKSATIDFDPTTGY